MVVDEIEWSNTSKWRATRLSGVTPISGEQVNYGVAENHRYGVVGSPWAEEPAEPAAKAPRRF